MRVPSALPKQRAICFISVRRDVAVGRGIVDGVDYGLAEGGGHAFPPAGGAEDNGVVGARCAARDISAVSKHIALIGRPHTE